MNLRRRLSPVTGNQSRTKTTVVFIKKLRQKIGVAAERRHDAGHLERPTCFAAIEDRVALDLVRGLRLAEGVFAASSFAEIFS